MPPAMGVNVTPAAVRPARGSMVGEASGLPLVPETRPAPIAGSVVSAS